MKHIIDDNDKNKYEAMDKAETLAAIQQIIEEGEIPTELINGVALTLRNPLDNQDYKIAFCTQAKYNELEANEQIEENCYYYITDDTTWDDFVAYIQNIVDGIASDVENLQERVAILESIIQTDKPNIESIETPAIDGGFSSFVNNTTSTWSCNPTTEITPLNVRVKLNPSRSWNSILEAKIEYVSGDDGFIRYENAEIDDAGYINFTARTKYRNYGTNDAIAGPNHLGNNSAQTTFKLTIKSIYNTEFTKEFTISYKYW